MSMLIDPMSLRCAEALPIRLVESSHDLGWTSVLVEQHEVLPSESAFETLPTSDQTIVVMIRGEQHLQSYRNGAWHSTIYRPGSVGLTPAGAINRLQRSINRDTGAAYKINLYVPMTFFAEAADYLGGGMKGLRKPLFSLDYLDETIHRLALSLIRAMRSGAPDIYAESAARWLALHMSIFADGVGNEDRFSTGEVIGDQRLRKALECIEGRYMEPISIADVAAAAGISRFHFSRLFRQATGTPPHRRLLETRLQAGRRLLETSDLSVAEVAARCGFERSNYFATQYGRRFGISPRDARLKNPHRN